METQFYQDWYPSLVNKDQVTEGVKLEHIQEQNQKKKQKKKCHGNRKLQRSHRKLRKQGLNFATDIQASVTHVTIEQSEQNQLNECVSMDHDSVDYTTLSDEILSEKISVVFNRSERFNSLFNGDHKIQFIRQYMSLIDQLSYKQLQETQWKYYHHIGTTQNIWYGRMSKVFAHKHSVCSSYGRTKTLIEHRLKQMGNHLKQAQSAMKLFEEEIMSKCEHNDDCLSAMKQLSSILYQLVQKKQQTLQHDFEYQRRMLILDATDHQLIQNFYNVKPNRNHMTWARHIWRATKEEMTIEDDIALLEQRLASTSVQTTFNLVHDIINNINRDIEKYDETMKSTTNNHSLIDQINKLNALKTDIIQQAILATRRKTEQLNTIVQTEKNRFLKQNRFMKKTFEWQIRVRNAIESRRLHMIERANYIKQHRLATEFNMKN